MFHGYHLIPSLLFCFPYLCLYSTIAMFAQTKKYSNLTKEVVLLALPVWLFDCLFVGLQLTLEVV